MTIKGEPLDERSNIWAFGVLLFEMVTCQLPFSGESITAVLVAILNAPLPDLIQLREDVPPSLQTLIEKMLIKERSRRMKSMRFVGAELEQVRSQCCQ